MQATTKELQEQAKVLLSAAFAALVHYKELIIALKQIKKAATQLDKLPNKEDNKEDSILSNKETLNKDFNLLTCSYLSNQLPNTP